MNLTWISIITVAGLLVLLLAACGVAARFLYLNRPKPDDKPYFWDEK